MRGVSPIEDLRSGINAGIFFGSACLGVSEWNNQFPARDIPDSTATEQTLAGEATASRGSQDFLGS